MCVVVISVGFGGWRAEKGHSARGKMCVMHCGVARAEEASGYCITLPRRQDELRRQRQQRDCESGGGLPAGQWRDSGLGNVRRIRPTGFTMRLPCGDRLTERNRKRKKKVRSFFLGGGRGEMEAGRGP